MSVAQILSGNYPSSTVAGSLLYAGIGTAVAATLGFNMPGLVTLNYASLATLTQNGPIPVSTSAGTLGNVTPAVAARTVCIPLTVANASTATVLTAGLLAAGTGAGQSWNFAGASANNAGVWLVMVFA